MAWLSGWNNRIECVISNTNIILFVFEIRGIT